MKAIVCEEYGSPDVLKLKDVEKPTPRADEVLVKIHAASAAAGDWHLMRADPFAARFMYGLFKPKYPILGADVAGRVEAVGKNVTQFKPGDAVFGDLSGSGFGGFAEYVAAPEKALAPKPARLTFDEAAAVPVSALTALLALRDQARVQPGHKVLINGASGGVGTFAVQIARALGAEVTAVCSTTKMALVRAIGAEHVIDYTREDFTHSGQRYDVILGANGFHPLSAYQRALTPNGVYVMTGGTPAQMFQAMLLGPWRSRAGSQKLSNSQAKPSQKDLIHLAGLLEAGKVVPVIDRRYPLCEVPDAIRYLEEGHARGKVVITIQA
ncbi:MAG: NAD(P)-dependent alcohol dehydrogenase [Thermoflexales bacterium]|nr:NAD(P)-dependent alcohol dehydrogenase [Thermoflexales bacterium]